MRCLALRQNHGMPLLWLMLACLLGMAIPIVPACAAEPVKIGVLAFRSKPQTLAQWQPLAAALKQAMPERDFVVEALTYSELDMAVAARQLNFVLTNSAHYILLAKRSGLSAPLATLAADRQGKAITVSGGVIFCRAGQAKINSLADLRGKTIAAIGTGSVGGYQAQAYELKQQGVRLSQDAKLLITGAPHDNVVDAVLAGRADAGFVYTSVLEALVHEGKLDMAQLKILNRQDLPGFPVQASTRLYPNWPFAALPHIDENLSRHVAAALFMLEGNAVATKAMGIHGFVIPADYTVVSDMLRELRLPPFDSAPEFTLHDVWHQYRWWIIITLIVAGSILLLGIRLLMSNRKLSAERRVVLRQKLQLEESERRYHFLFNNNPMPMWVFAKDSLKFLEVNERAIEHYGYTREEFSQLTLCDIRPVEDIPELARVISSSPDGRISTEARHKKKDGTLIDVLISTMPVEYGTTPARIVLIQDITERKQAEKALRDSEQRFKDIVNSTDGIVWEADASTFNFTFISQQAERLLGYPIEDWLKPGFWVEHLHPDDKDWAPEYCASCTHRLEQHDFEYRFIARDGRTVWLRDLVAVVAEDGMPRWLRGIMMDITERKAIQKQVADQLAFTEAVIKAEVNALAVCHGIAEHPYVRFTVWNQSMETLTGYCMEEANRLGWYQTVYADPEVQEQVRQRMERMRQGDHLRGEEWTITRKNGEHRVVRIHTVTVAEDSLGAHVLAVMRDITERKQAEKLLWEKSQLLDSIVENIPNMIFLKRVSDLRFELFNHAGEALVGRSRDELLGRNDYDFFPKEQADFFTGKDRATLEQNGIVDIPEELIETPHGTRILHTRKLALRDEQGQPRYLLGISEDITERKHAERELRTLSTAIEQSPLSVVITDLDAKIQYANPCFLSTTGYSMEEAIGQNPRILKSGQTPKETYVEMWKALGNGQTWRGELVNKRKSGEFYWEEAHIAPVMDSAGSTMLYVAVKLEITRRKKAEEALRESEARFRAIIEATPVPLALNDEQGNITYLNRAFIQTVGYTTDDIPTVGDWWPRAYPDPQYRQWAAASWQKNLEEAKRTNEPFTPLELNIRCKDGAVRIFMAGAAPIKEGFAGTHMVILYDITERKQADRVLIENEIRFRNLVETVNDWIWEVDENAVYTYASPRIHGILGYDAAEIIGKTPFDFMPPEEAKRVAGIFGQIAAARMPFTNIENINLHKDGYAVVLETCGIPIIDAEGKFRGYRGIDRDITERKKFEAEILRSNVELEQFSYAISHDMRQPLRMISSYLQLIEMELADQLDGEKRSYFNFAIEGAKRIDQMLVALLEYSRLGRMGDTSVWIESRAVLDEALLFLQPAIIEAQARLDITGDWPRIFANRDEILRLIQNLMSNAVKFRVAGRTPEITVNSKVARNEWQLCVTDNGAGIIPSQIKRLFQVFQRLQLRTAYEGNGVGLALCRKIAEHHKGRIWVESAGEGQGSKFCAVLPVLREEIIFAGENI